MFEVSRIGIARGFSIFGHPMIMLPASALLVSLELGSVGRMLGVIGTAMIVSAGLGAWAKRKVAEGQWSHVDASDPAERLQWNRVVLASFIAVAALFAAFDSVIAVGALALAFIILCAMLLAPWLKLSQHTAFTILSAWVAGAVDPVIGGVFAILALGVMWSRLALDRHTLLDVVVGAVCGSVTGAGLWVLAGKFPF